MCLWLFGKPRSGKTPGREGREIQWCSDVGELLETGGFLSNAASLSKQPCWLCGFVPHLLMSALQGQGGDDASDDTRRRLNYVFAITQISLASRPLAQIVDTLREAEGKSPREESELSNILGELDRLSGAGSYATRVLRDRIWQAKVLLRNSLSR